MGVDLTEYRRPVGSSYEVHAVLSPAQSSELKALGFDIQGTIYDDEDAKERIAERSRTLTQLRAFAAAGADTLTPLRAEWFTSIDGRRFLSVEVKTGAPDATNIITAAWNSGAGTAPGSGGSRALSRFVDANVYMYHRLASPIPIGAAPTEITYTSTLGGTVTVPVTEWLGAPREAPAPTYMSDFVDHYMDATEVTNRITALAAQYPGISEIVELPYLTNGYRRQAQAQFGLATGSAVGSSFYVTSKAWGHEGGNNLTIAVEKPATNPSNLRITLTGGKDFTVQLATNAAGTVTSTAAQVVAAINGDSSNLITAATLRGNAGAGLVAVGARISLSDGLNPAVNHEPFRVKALRIGKTRDGSKTGVFLYSQEHAREWVTPLVAVETASRLLHNYSTDAGTKALVDDLDIFILPVVNPDGSHYSFNNYNMQRRNMTNHCAADNADPGRRNAWGVDLNRNFSVGSLFDGYSGASSSCVSDTFAGPSELSEPEAKNEVWLTEQFKNIKFAMNTHSYGGYFMWAPGAYKSANRELLPRPDLGTNDFFWSASEHILGKLKQSRNSAVWPGRVGPIPDVLYSAAGNSADEHWTNRGIIGWSFEAGADVWDAANGRFVAVGFQPEFASEGHAEALEFADGWLGILEVARNYEHDKTAPKSELVITKSDASSTSFTFKADEAANFYYTTDGSAPTRDSAKLASAGVREGAESITVTQGTIVNWFSTDLVGNIEGGYNASGADTGYRTKAVKVGAPAEGPGLGLQVITASVNGSPLRMRIDNNEQVYLGKVVLDGSTQYLDGNLNKVSVRDPRGTSAGWSLTGQATDFVSPASRILAGNLGWSPTARVVPGDGLVIEGPAPTVNTGPVVAPGTGLGSARTLCSAPVGTGMGQFECGGALKLGIPGSTAPGKYDSVLTLTLS